MIEGTTESAAAGDKLGRIHAQAGCCHESYRIDLMSPLMKLTEDEVRGVMLLVQEGGCTRVLCVVSLFVE